MTEPVRKITPSDRSVADPTAGIVREEAFSTGQIWAGLARTQPGTTSGWHHHGTNETTVYVEAGVFRVEFVGPDGTDVCEGHAGDFVFVPPNVVHRESNPSDVESRLIVVRAGADQPTYNVDAPE
jgi:uncharacterized RmlC-like cupin family protein